MDKLNIVDFMEYCKDKGYLSAFIGDICVDVPYPGL